MTNRMIVPDSRKSRKSYTLSPESVAFLEVVAKARQSVSVSAVLDELILNVRRTQQREALDRAVAGYYSGLTSDDAKEQAQWGDFALTEFPGEERA